MVVAAAAASVPVGAAVAASKAADTFAFLAAGAATVY